MSIYCRLSYNHNGWNTPSGPIGKSIDINTHECQFGFGFEEWFFNKRRFLDENGNDCHLAYLDPFRYYNHRLQANQDLILYSFERIPNNLVNRFVVCNIPKNGWRFVDHKRYLTLLSINAAIIPNIQAELNAAPLNPIFPINIALNRFQQQTNCQDYNGFPSVIHRLWNIEIFKPVDIITKHTITTKSLFPLNEILTRNRFRIYQF
jgi:hypothetical protein